jgi:hypothetical protein
MSETEWLCRGCEYDVEKLVVQAPIVPATIHPLGVIPGSPQVLIMVQKPCERCGDLKNCFEYEKTVKPVPEISEGYTVKEGDPFEELEELPDLPEPPVAEVDLLAELEALKARIEKAEKAE